ncbi:DUF917 domain-containing protein [Arthrobacter sp. R4]|uniref:DUF917 domain-containing protein n=1 Tax=Arthrobacter sp. R4 TaxID=644417 RepID=UPI003F52243A
MVPVKQARAVHLTAEEVALPEKIRCISADDLAALAIGCAIYGTGGGGQTQSAVLFAGRAIRDNGPVRLVSFDELDPEGLVMPLGGIGAPTVSEELLHSRGQAQALVEALERRTGRKVVAIMPTEIGGSNGVEPVAWAAELGLPIVDADGIGRAFPEIQMVSMNVAGLEPTLAAVSDVLGNVVLIDPISAKWTENIARAVTVAVGATALLTIYVYPASVLKPATVLGSISRSLAVGRAILGSPTPIATACELLDATILLAGKIIDIERSTAGGFVTGSVVVAGLGEHAGRMLRIEIQNENLIAFEDGVPVAMAPDLISVIDSHTGHAIATENLRFGQRVTGISWGCDPLWLTDTGLQVAGPRAFGYPFDYSVPEVQA